jgi:hypothetical protein
MDKGFVLNSPRQALTLLPNHRQEIEPDNDPQLQQTTALAKIRLTCDTTIYCRRNHKLVFLIQTQINSESCSLSRLARYLDTAAVVLDDPVTNRKA